MNEPLNRLFVSMAGAAGIIILLFLAAIFLAEAPSFAGLGRVFYGLVTWPLLIFMRIFPRPSDYPSPAPTLEAIIAALLADVLVYSLIVALILRLCEKQRRVG